MICVDLPGFGKNAHLEPIDRIDVFAAWVLDQLSAREVDRFDLLGHSMGGMIAQEIAFRDSERIERLVLYATGAIGVLPGRFETIDEAGTKFPRVHLESPDKQLVGRIAARIRQMRPPEPYNGKGVRYTGERIREKAGKAGKAGA